MIRIGRYTINNKQNKFIPFYKGFTTILIDYNSEYKDLAPWNLKDNDGKYIENIWQFSKVYEEVHDIRQLLSQQNPEVIWEHGEETHIKNNKLTGEYYKWRAKGISHTNPVMNPNGILKNNKHKYIIMQQKNGTFSEPLNRVDAIKQLYIPLYCSAVKSHPLFKKLKLKLNSGTKLLIIEKDGPNPELLRHYIGTYKVKPRFFHNKTMEVTRDNINIILEDKLSMFGFGYCLAMALLDKDKEWNDNIIYQAPKNYEYIMLSDSEKNSSSRNIKELKSTYVVKSTKTNNKKRYLL